MYLTLIDATMTVGIISLLEGDTLGTSRGSARTEKANGVLGSRASSSGCTFLNSTAVTCLRSLAFKNPFYASILFLHRLYMVS